MEILTLIAGNGLCSGWHSLTQYACSGGIVHVQKEDLEELRLWYIEIRFS